LLTPLKPGGDDTFESKVVVLDLTPPLRKFDEEPTPGTPLLTFKFDGPPLIGDCGEELKPVDPLLIPSNEFTLSYAVVPLVSCDVKLCFTKPDPVLDENGGDTPPLDSVPFIVGMPPLLSPKPAPTPMLFDGTDADMPFTGIPVEPAVKPDD
jgi:hypothetical protein